MAVRPPAGASGALPAGAGTGSTAAPAADGSPAPRPEPPSGPARQRRDRPRVAPRGHPGPPRSRLGRLPGGPAWVRRQRPAPGPQRWLAGSVAAAFDVGSDTSRPSDAAAAPPRPQPALPRPTPGRRLDCPIARNIRRFGDTVDGQPAALVDVGPAGIHSDHDRQRNHHDRGLGQPVLRQWHADPQPAPVGQIGYRRFDPIDQVIAVEAQVVGVAAQESERVRASRQRRQVALLDPQEIAGFDPQRLGDVIQILAPFETLWRS